MKIGPSPQIALMFDGQCEAAFKFYERCLNGKIEFMLRWGASPAANEAPPEWAQKIIHARLVIGEAVILGSDPLPAAYVSPRGFSLLLTLEDRTKTDELFAALAQDGTVAMPVQQTFWSERFGVVIDQFGVQWDITCG